MYVYRLFLQVLILLCNNNSGLSPQEDAIRCCVLDCVIFFYLACSAKRLACSAMRASSSK